jgi:hypothetical protein
MFSNARLSEKASLKTLAKMQSKVSITSSQVALISQFEIKSPKELIDDIAVNKKVKIKKLE